MGIPSEIALRETSNEGEASPDESPKDPSLSQSLREYIVSDSRHWIPCTHGIDTEDLLLSHCRSQYQLKAANSNTLLEGYPLAKASEYESWSKSPTSQILYVDCSSSHKSQTVADEIFLSWRTKYQAPSDTEVKALSFAFDTYDPLQNNLRDMLMSWYLQIPAGNELRGLDAHTWRVDGIFSSQPVASVLGHFTNWTTIVLLYNFDECDSTGQTTFLKYYREFLQRKELSFKLIITLGKPGVLEKMLKDWLRFDATASPIQLRQRGDGVEDLTPLIMAQRCGVDRKIIDTLRKAIQERVGTADTGAYGTNGGVIKLYRVYEYTCDHCQNVSSELKTVYGPVFGCDRCDDYGVCTKRIVIIEEYHNSTNKKDGKPHLFKVSEDRSIEYDEPSVDEDVTEED
ncbi:hypothetical protein GQ44DRAFT_732874 [Phaeosphaeriaceae sp. PMI808]|nr:hypothetical protein GQ44DRAFT_732874 [Phaeosphaeriaceae sp. PMI808]